MKQLLALGALTASLLFTAACNEPVAPAPSPPPAPPGHLTTTPVPRTEPWWTERQALLNERAAAGSVELVFIGDSITQGWEGAGKNVWSESYGDRAAINLGIGGDRTQHVLWRLEHGNLPDGLSPKLAVVMIGTNNSGSNTPRKIEDGVTAIARRLWIELPETQILVLAIFPRGAGPDDPLRKVNGATNALLGKLPGLFDDGRVHLLDIGTEFLAADGTLSQEIMPDLLHLSPEGYRIWARAIEPVVAELLRDEARSF